MRRERKKKEFDVWGRVQTIDGETAQMPVPVPIGRPELTPISDTGYLSPVLCKLMIRQVRHDLLKPHKWSRAVLNVAVSITMGEEESGSEGERKKEEKNIKRVAQKRNIKK